MSKKSHLMNCKISTVTYLQFLLMIFVPRLQIVTQLLLNIDKLI